MLDELLRDLVDDCSVEAEARGCKFTVICSGEIAMAGDRELVRRAIENVMRNALQYSPEGKVVNVQLESGAGTATIRVKDEGSGVSEKDLTRIFDPFFRADDSRTAATGGMGLGLSIAMRAVRLHNGRIEAQNSHPGLLVTITIPTNGIPVAP
jgi:two-component system sensor histidine kinase CpxA